VSLSNNYVPIRRIGIRRNVLVLLESASEWVEKAGCFARVEEIWLQT